MDISIFQHDNITVESSFLTTVESELLSSEQINVVLNQLTSTIDLATLASLYFSQLDKFLPLTGIDMSELDPSLKIENCQGDVSVTMQVPACSLDFGKHAAFIRYYFDEPLSPNLRRILGSLHQLFTKPLMHALEFRRMRLMATKDPLTGLGNRNGFNDAAQRLINRHARSGEMFGLLVVDLDNFKQVNDKHGHQQGDEVLLTAARIVGESIRGHEEAYRFGGDEFCCLVDVKSERELSAIARRIHRAMHKHPLLSRHKVTCSIGGSLLRSDDSINALFSRADKAMYEAKEDGKDTYQAA
ncbi:GGDEF domain-containing protein [Alteromonas gilva]|uniref:diguanylate cyclase n=1 Tax=Alteromonas gilva TaxID=2987522 RepID=A0ABT5L070_9ALTE|nr:GGDEF domain-containing protein [Alteromonas gilva]MDC8830420.1 GGDEF domain-containing protein [Alteromonas gilva]